jgi:hypothetical protein
LAAANFSKRFDDKIDRKYVDLPIGISRFMFMELIVKLAKFLYGTTEAHTMREV